MNKKILLTVSIILIHSIKLFSQSLYNRVWSDLLPYYEVSDKPFTPSKSIVRTSLFIAEVNKKTGNLYVVDAKGIEILEYSPNNSNSRSVYKIPEENAYGTQIENLKIDNENNLIITGKTISDNFSTKGVYSESIIIGLFTKPTFVAKVDLKGNLLWSTYFHDLTTNAANLTVDKNNDIYILTKRDKQAIVSPSYFQDKGDFDSTIDFQDVISKIDSKGKHVWSTFYTKDNSKIKSIEASDNGLYVYGEHMGSNSKSNYFGTKDSFQEFASGTTVSNNSCNVFLSKFSFDGKRLWSTYLGSQISNTTSGATLKNNANLTVINDEAYILTTHKETGSQIKNMATEGVYLDKPTTDRVNLTLTKFSSKGNKLWSTYLYAGEHLYSNNKKLFITSSLMSGNYPIEKLPITANAYQSKFGGEKIDVYTSIISTDGKLLDYASFYGFEGRDAGVTFPTNNGYYIIGTTDLNKSSSSNFTSIKTKELFNYRNFYAGDFISYFKLNK